jgi:hypothetical protein
MPRRPQHLTIARKLEWHLGSVGLTKMLPLFLWTPTCYGIWEAWDARIARRLDCE